MALYEESVKLGNKIFRWRTYLPLVFLLTLIPAYFDLARDPDREFNLIWDMFCFGLALLGLVIRAMTIAYAPAGTSGRNTKRQVAQKLNVDGIYSVVRNPLYLGNFFMVIGIMLFIGIWYVPLLYALGFWLYYERIILAEEAFLQDKFGEAYHNWADCTPAFWPRLGNWQPATDPFSFNRILKREHNGLMAMLLLFFLFDLFRKYAVYHEIRIEDPWKTMLIIGFGLFLLVEILRKTGFFRRRPSQAV